MPPIDDLPDYCFKIMQEVKDKTGFPVHLSPEEHLEDDSFVKYRGHRAEKSHTILYQKKREKHLAHFIMRDCTKILQLWAEPSGKRVIPNYDYERILPPIYHEYFCNSLPDALSENLKIHASNHFFCCFMNQLTTYPIFTRLEKKVHDCKEHHELQVAHYIDKSQFDARMMSSRENWREIHDDIVTAIWAMGYAMMHLVGETIGVECRWGAEGEVKDLTDKLIAISKNEKDEGWKGNIRVTDLWAMEMGFRDLYWWQSLED